MLDPYQVLGVAREADAATIKAAYRRLAKTAHPDQGGDKETFEAIKFAYDILRNPDRRAQYDRDGTVHFIPESMIDAKAVELIADIIGNILMGNSDPNKNALIQPMVDFCAEKIRETEQHNLKLITAKDRAERMVARFRKKEGKTGPNVLADITRRKIVEAEQAIAGNDTTIKVMRRALKIIESHEFDFDRVHQVQYQYFGATTAGTGSALGGIFGG